MSCFSWILLQIVLGIYWKYLIMTTSKRGWRIVRVGTMIVCFSDCCFQYKLEFSCIEQIYCDLTTNSPEEITFPLIVVLFYSLYASDMSWITYNPLVVMSYVLMEPYITDWTNDTMLSIITSRTTWCISSNT